MYVTFCKKSILSWVNKRFGISAVHIIIIKFYTFNMIDNSIFSKDENYQTSKPKEDMSNNVYNSSASYLPIQWLPFRLFWIIK